MSFILGSTSFVLFVIGLLFGFAGIAESIVGGTEDGDTDLFVGIFFVLGIVALLLLLLAIIIYITNSISVFRKNENKRRAWIITCGVVPFCYAVAGWLLIESFSLVFFGYF